MALRVALAVAAVVCLAAAPGAHAAPISSHGMLYACCTPFEMKERIFAESAALGADYVRVDIQVADVFEADRGGRAPAPDWRGVEDVIALSRRYGVKVLAILLHPPSWLSSCPERFPHHHPCAAADAAEFGRLAGEIAAHAGRAIDHWEIINEPDGEWAFEGSVQEYAAMLMAASAAIKARSPGDQVLLGGVMRPHEPAWLEQLFAVPGAGRSFDIANVHLRGPVDSVVGRYLEVRQRLAWLGFSGPLWITEHGYSADPAYQGDPVHRGGAAAQASYLTQSLVGLGEQGAEQIFVTLRDLGGQGEFAAEGIARIEEAPGHSVERRPAFAAVQRVVSGWTQLLAWRAEQRRHEGMQLFCTAAAVDWRDRAATGAQRLRQARTLLASTRLTLARAARRGGAVVPPRRRSVRARARVARFKRELGWARALRADYLRRAAGHAAAVADLRGRIAGI